jgi:hypothetical protein
VFLPTCHWGLGDSEYDAEDVERKNDSDRFGSYWNARQCRLDSHSFQKDCMEEGETNKDYPYFTS